MGRHVRRTARPLYFCNNLIRYACESRRGRLAFFIFTLKVEVRSRSIARRPPSPLKFSIACKLDAFSHTFAGRYFALSCSGVCWFVSPSSSLQPSPHPSPPALFYFALLLPGVPFALIMWKMKYGADDFDDFLEHCMPAWFLFLSFLIFFGPALAIGKSFALCNPSLLITDPPPSSAAVAGVGALACFLVSFPCLLFSSKRNIYSKVLQKSFLAFALPPAVAVSIALFPFSIPAYFLMHDDD